jgi:hypothetical protein
LVAVVAVMLDMLALLEVLEVEVDTLIALEVLAHQGKEILVALLITGADYRL